jgi:hypothetical protein
MADTVDDQIDFIIADFERYTRGEVIALTLNIDANLRENPPLGTPVDTGWARANWVPSIGEPKFLEDKKDPAPGDIASRAQAAAQGQNDVLSWDKTKGALFVSNGVPYIGALNAGHSSQSPSGFVQNAIEKAIRQTYSQAGSRAGLYARGDNARAAAGKPKNRPGK